MKIYSIYFYSRGPDGKMTLVDSAADFTDIGIFYRKNAKEICDFAVLQLADGKNANQNITVHQNKYVISLYRATPNTAVVIATDEDYPSRPAFTILREVANEYQTNGNRFNGGKSLVIQKAIVDYQDPARADKILRIQKNIEETQNIMVMNLEEAIGRGEKLDEMMEKSNQISESSKVFIRQSKKLNKCNCS